MSNVKDIDYSLRSKKHPSVLPPSQPSSTISSFLSSVPLPLLFIPDVNPPPPSPPSPPPLPLPHLYPTHPSFIHLHFIILLPTLPPFISTITTVIYPSSTFNNGTTINQLKQSHDPSSPNPTIMRRIFSFVGVGSALTFHLIPLTSHPKCHHICTWAFHHCITCYVHLNMHNSFTIQMCFLKVALLHLASLPLSTISPCLHLFQPFIHSSHLCIISTLNTQHPSIHLTFRPLGSPISHLPSSISTSTSTIHHSTMMLSQSLRLSTNAIITHQTHNQ